MRKAIKFLVCLAVLVPVLATPAAGQVLGLYYQEVEKDGRIYVFNTPERYKSWSEGGEIGTAITLIGRGPNGETVVAENETAADLFFFRHNLPGYERETPKPPKKVEDYITYKDGKLGFKFSGGEVSLSNRVQARYTYVDDIEARGVEDIGSFRIRRAKTTIEGRIYEDWKFKLQANWVGVNIVESAALAGTTLNTTVSRGAILEDAELTWAKYPLASIWGGQGKPFFGRQELTSSGRQQFVDRTLMSNRFHPVRDQGLALIGMNSGKTIEYAAGVFNGNLLNRAANDNKDYMYVGRFVWTPFGEYKLEESSLDYPATPKLALGANWMENTLGRITSTANLKTDIERLNGEVAFKWQGFNAVAEYCEETSTPQATGVDTDSDGYYVQVGYLFPNQKFEIAGRTSEFDSRPLVSTAFPDVTEEGLAFSWYFSKHNHKLQADWLQFERQTSPTAAPIKTDEMRLQLQLVF